jgi:hypothetical protein
VAVEIENCGEDFVMVVIMFIMVVTCGVAVVVW